MPADKKHPEATGTSEHTAQHEPPRRNAHVRGAGEWRGAGTTGACGYGRGRGRAFARDGNGSRIQPGQRTDALHLVVAEFPAGTVVIANIADAANASSLEGRGVLFALGVELGNWGVLAANAGGDADDLMLGHPRREHQALAVAMVAP